MDRSADLRLVSSELTYTYSPRDRRVYFWQLPYQFLGNKLAAYGGNMTIVQTFTTSNSRMVPVADSDIIMIGNDLGRTRHK